MKGDFTRGHQPDQKRGQNYRRVLLQQGRLLLDSDFNALVDAHDELLRDLSRDTACLAGSPDLGYLVTAGRLLAVFDDLQGIEVTAGDLELYRDYRHKYLDRYPSLYLSNTSGALATVRIPLRAATNGEIDLWMRSDGVSQVTIEGTALNITSPSLEPVTLNPANTRFLDISLANGQEVWLALVERHQEAGTLPTFWAAQGRFHIDGLMVEIPQDGPYSDLHFDPADGFQIPDLEVDDGGLRPLQAGDRVLAYLEAFERHVTHVEDRGILEEALGGRDDTTTRSQAMCQIKVAAALGLEAEDLRQAVRNPLLPDGTLDVITAPVVADPDPCALPVAGGYRGTDNRLYRFEVHRGGGVLASLFKWSRDNGSELFRARDVTVAGPVITQLIFAAECPLESGDLVEVLDEPHELGDQAFALVDDGAGTFTAPERAVGRLVRLHAAAGPVDGKTFSLSEPDDDSLVVTLDDFGAPPDPLPRVRRWHGLIEPAGADPFQIEVEDGIEIEVTGSFRAGDWWQYEARARRGNDNGPFQTSPHGPERLFAPLGLFEYQGENDPLELVAWLDERFPRLCGICADDVCFDGERVGAAECDTVQEALEKLFERESGDGCCEFSLSPQPAGDDAGRLRDLLDQEPGDLTICLRPGIYRFESILTIEGRCLTLVGCPEAVIVASVGDNVGAIRITDGGRLRLRNLVLFAPLVANAPISELIALSPTADGFEARETALVLAGPNPNQVAIRGQGMDPLAFDPADPARSLGDVPLNLNDPMPTVSLVDCIVVAGWAIVAEELGNLEIRSSAFYLTAGGVSCSRILGAQVFDNSWLVGVSRDLTAGWTALELSREPKRLFDQLEEDTGPLRGAIGQPGGVVAWLVQTLMLGTFERNIVVATRGAVIANAQVCQWADNLYQTDGHGIDLAEADNSTLTRELIGFRGGRVGIQVSSANRLRIRDCLVVGDGIGLRLGGDEQVEFGPDGEIILAPRPVGAAAAEAPRLTSVQVVGNRISGQIGVQLGAVGVNGFFGFVSEVSLHQNQVQSRVGMLVRGPASGFLVTDQISVTDNELSVSEVGVDLRGAGISVTGNRLVIEAQSGPAAIRAFEALGVIISGNTITGLLGFESFGIWCENSIRCQIQDNHVGLGEGVPSLYLVQCPSARVIDNDFGFGSVRVASCNDLTLQGNEASLIEISDSEDGTIRGNQVSFDLRSHSAAGRWQMQDNRAGGRIELLPDGLVGPGFGGGLVVGGNVLTRRGGEWGGAVIDFLGSDDGESPRGRSLSVVRGAENRAAISYAAETPDWREAWATSALEELDLFWIEELQVLEEAVIVLNIFFEREYHAQLVGNWAGTLRVGHDSALQGISGSRDTVVQVTSNRADSVLDVRPYVHALVSSNAASNLTPWIARQTNVNGPNIQF